MSTGIPFRNFLTLLILFSALANLILGALVLIDSPRRKVNRLFSILCFNLAFWGVAFIGISFSTHPSTLLIWSRLYAASLIFVPPLFYHLILGSLGAPLKGDGILVSNVAIRVKQLAYVFSGGWIVFMAGGIFPQKGFQVSFFFPSISQQFWIAATAYTLVTIAGTILLIQTLSRSRDPNQKNRLLYLLIGSTTILVGGMLNFFLVHSLNKNIGWLITFGHLGSTLCLVLIAYALTTNQMYQFAELSRKTIAFVAMTMILLAVFGGTHFISSVLLVPYVPQSNIFALGTASIIMSLLFHPLRFRVQNMVDRVFFTKRYDQMQRLRGLSRRVLSSADRDELLNNLFSSLNSIGFGSISLLLKDPQKPIFNIKKSLGLGDPADGFFLKSDSLLIQYLREEKEELIRDEVLRRIMADWERQALGDEMDILQAEICFPLFSTRRRALFGLIAMGNSELGNSSYKGRNIFWLKSVIDNAGIMLDNFYHHEFANALIPYVGRTWADEMRRNKEGFRERLSGHRTWVSVIMVDIRHFTSMSARMDPRQVVDLLKDFRLRIAPIVYRYQGTIDKFIGDAIMIVFGLPILPKLDNADKNAVECALDIQKEMGKLNETYASEGRRERISIGIGVSSGEVIAGNVDSGDRVEYTVIGDAANMVARLEDLAGDDQILLSPATYERVKNHVVVHRWEPRTITGFAEPVSIHELIRMGHTETLHPSKDKSKPSSSDQMAANQ